VVAAAAFAEALEAALTNGAFDALARVLLHRARVEDGLFETVSRDAVLAELVALAAVGDAWEVQRIGDCVVARGARTCAWWVEGEGARVAALTRVDARGADAGAAVPLGAAHPAHRPVGELRSGRAQFAPEAGGRTIGQRYARAVDARALAGLPQRGWWLRLLARVPDAAVTLDRENMVGGEAAVLWRVQGHVAGRRVSLPGISLLALDGETVTAEEPLLDMLALEASAYRPFL
jgi:hypothetical protein